MEMYRIAGNRYAARCNFYFWKYYRNEKRVPTCYTEIRFNVAAAKCETNQQQFSCNIPTGLNQQRSLNFDATFNLLAQFKYLNNSYVFSITILFCITRIIFLNKMANKNQVTLLLFKINFSKIDRSNLMTSVVNDDVLCYLPQSYDHLASGIDFVNDWLRQCSDTA